jgi:hypothetical protein
LKEQLLKVAWKKSLDFVPDMTTIGSALCAFDSGYSLENDDANLDVIRAFIST